MTLKAQVRFAAAFLVESCARVSSAFPDRLVDSTVPSTTHHRQLSASWSFRIHHLFLPSIWLLNSTKSFINGPSLLSWKYWLFVSV